jgi:hypothetical protein
VAAAFSIVIGRYVSDLQVGDVLPPMEYVITPFLVREYCHGVEETDERFLGAGAHGPQLVPPTMVHTDKIRMLEHACPEGAGPVPRMQYEYAAEHVRPIEAGTRLRITGEVVERTERNGRERLVLAFELRDATTGELLTRYRDMAMLNFRPREGS